jgi:bifunctional non-homologous end joining protein LigD
VPFKRRSDPLCEKAPARVQYSEHLEGDGAAIFAHVCELGAEGIVSKRRDHPYRAGPSKGRLKIKNPTAPGMLRFREEP